MNGKHARQVCTSLAAILLGLPLACNRDLPPYGQALVIVDTDVPVPGLVDRLRVDSFRADGTWVSSRDLAVPDARDWPVSFGVYSDDELHDNTIVLRLRAYTGGRVRDYRGERFVDPDVPPASDPPANAPPRLVAGQSDVTPATEPQPESAIDRLVAIVLSPGKTGAVSITLRGDCFGTMARLSSEGSYSPLVATEAASCDDTPHVRTPLQAQPIRAKLSSPPPSLQGSWLNGDGCAREDTTSTAICIPSGAFFLGGRDSAAEQLGSLPEHPVRLSRFWIDANEVTVGDWRAAVANGFRSPTSSPGKHDTTFPTNGVGVFPACTYSSAPIDRETYPVNCITWAAARAFCEARGGDLSSEAQWEYVAAAAGKDHESRYPWGDDAPSCRRVVYGRLEWGMVQPPAFCNRAPWPFGPAPVESTGTPGKDASPLGVFNMTGNVAEWVLGSAQALDGQCWEAVAPTDPVCMDGHTFMTRGGDWIHIPLPNDYRRAAPHDLENAGVGFRCAYPTKPPG